MLWLTGRSSFWNGTFIADEANEGWFYYEIPNWANSIIVNEGVDGGGQTTDVTILSKLAISIMIIRSHSDKIFIKIVLICHQSIEVIDMR